jgi:hypothetical protein
MEYKAAEGEEPAKYIYDNLYAKPSLTNGSLRPIHDQIMHTEATRLAQLRYVLGRLQVPPRAILDVKTDALVICAGKKRPMVQAMQFTAFADLPNLRRKFERADVRQRFINDSGVVQRGSGSEEQVFRFSVGAKRLEGNYVEPWRTADPPTQEDEWQDLSQTEAEAHMAAGKNCLVLGWPGTGKSTMVRGVVQTLREAGKRVDIICKTHAAVQNFGEGAVTADFWVRHSVRNGAVTCQTLVVDELTQIDIALWADIALAAQLGIQVILSGDFAQFNAPGQFWAGCEVGEDMLQNSQLVRELAGYCRCTLTEN